MAIVNGKSAANINVTPLIDVLLVLLIIFMVIAPLQSVGLDVVVPQPSPDKPQSAPDRSIVVEIDRDLNLTINSQGCRIGDLPARLQEIFRLRADKSVFVRAAGDLDFRRVAAIIDIVKGSGIDRIGLLTKTS
jgi:biopolymer transport protein ExbD